MKISVYIAVSLDGFIAREDGSLDWLPGSQADDDNEAERKGEDYGYQAFMDTIDVLIMGRKTYETVLSFGLAHWPYGNKRVIVLSNTLTQISDKVPKTVTLKSGLPEELVKELQTAGVKGVYLDGGKTIQGFLKAGLVDELIITTIPILIGTGIRLFGPLKQDVSLHHLKTRSFANGFVQSRYEIIR